MVKQLIQFIADILQVSFENSIIRKFLRFRKI